jgi:hypothetical protein
MAAWAHAQLAKGVQRNIGLPETKHKGGRPAAGDEIG